MVSLNACLDIEVPVSECCAHFGPHCRCWYIAVVFLLYSAYSGGRETLEIGGSESRWEFVGILASITTAKLRSTETLVLAGDAVHFYGAPLVHCLCTTNLEMDA